MPSRDGGRGAVAHFIVYQAIFTIGVVVLYARLGAAGFTNQPSGRSYLTDIPIYLCMHLAKTALGSWTFLLARQRIYDRFATERYDRAALYVRELMRLAGVQLTVFIGFVASSAHEGLPSTARLMAATTLCVALPQTFWLWKCISDAHVPGESGGSLSRRFVRGQFYAVELLSYGAICIFTLIGLLAYFLSLEGDTAAWLDEDVARTLYYSFCGCYLLSASLVGCEMSARASRARKLAAEQLRAVSSSCSSASFGSVPGACAKVSQVAPAPRKDEDDEEA